MKPIKLLFIILYTSLLLLYPSNSTPAYAAAGCPQPGTMDNIVNSALLALAEEMPSPCFKAATQVGTAANAETTTGGKRDYTDNQSTGVLKNMSNSLAQLIQTKPVSSREYIADVMHNIVPGSPAYAQTGIGFSALDPVLPLWKAFRNVAYFLYVIIFVVIGFMIMFRSKINPQTVISIQAALPNLVVTLILITFSYAIAGLLIDLIYVVIYLAAFILSANGIFNDPNLVIGKLLNNNLYVIFFDEQNFMVTAPADAVKTVVSGLIGGALGATVGWAADGVSQLIIGIALTISVFKLFITLGLGFVKIILSVIIAPLHIMLNAFPGSTAFSTWFRGILSNVAMFPAVAVLFMLAAALVGPRDDVNNQNPWDVGPGVGYWRTDEKALTDAWTPPFLIGRGDEALLFQPNKDTDGFISPIVSILGLMVVLISPSIAQMARDALKVEASKYGSSIGGTLSQAGAGAMLPVRLARQHREKQTQADLQARSFARYLGKK